MWMMPARNAIDAPWILDTATTLERAKNLEPHDVSALKASNLGMDIPPEWRMDIGLRLSVPMKGVVSTAVAIACRIGGCEDP